MAEMYWLKSLVSAKTLPAAGGRRGRRAPNPQRAELDLSDELLAILETLKGAMKPKGKVGGRALTQVFLTMPEGDRADFGDAILKAFPHFDGTVAERKAKALGICKPEASGEAGPSTYSGFKERVGIAVLMGTNVLAAPELVREIAITAAFDYIGSYNPVGAEPHLASSLYINRSGESVSKGSSVHTLTVANIYCELYFHRAEQAVLKATDVAATLRVLKLTIPDWEPTDVNYPRGGVARVCRLDRDPLAKLVALLKYRIAAVEGAEGAISYFVDDQEFELACLPLILRGFQGHTGQQAAVIRVPAGLKDSYLRSKARQAPDAGQAGLAAATASAAGSASASASAGAAAAPTTAAAAPRRTERERIEDVKAKIAALPLRGEYKGSKPENALMDGVLLRFGAKISKGQSVEIVVNGEKKTSKAFEIIDYIAVP